MVHLWLPVLVLVFTVAQMTSCRTHICPEQHCSLTDTFLNNAITDLLKDDVPEVVAATLKVVEVSGDGVDQFTLRASGSISHICMHLCSVAV